VLAFCF